VISEAAIREALRGVLDPEVGVNIVDLGLVYGVALDGDGARIDLTMTTPACPLGETLVRETEAALREAGVTGPIDVNIVWEPPWRPDMMSVAAREQLGWPPSP
jgi:metal-sulfur cluster biosynthetic enzyme